MPDRFAVPVPERMQSLPLDPRGYPIPWNVLRGKDGAGIFTVNSEEKHLVALQKSLCPLCGERLGQWKWFLGGPLSAFHPGGCYLDLPGHRDCIEYALQVCPYLALPRYIGRIDVPNPANLPLKVPFLVDQTVIPERPELFVAVASSHIEMLPNPPLLPKVRPKKPILEYQFWRHGRKISQTEALPLIRQAMGAEWTL